MSLFRLLVGLYAPLSREALVMMVRAYVDETSSHRDPASPLILFAYGARVGRAIAFDKAWRKALAKGPASYAHAKEIIDGDGPFKGWDGQKKFNFTTRLDRVVHKHFDFGVCTVLKRADFESYRSHKEMHSVLDSDYGVSFRTILSFLQLAVPKIIPAKNHEIYVLAEDGHENSGCVSELHRRMRRELKDCLIKGASLVDKKECYGTQAADIHALPLLDLERAEIRGYQDVPVDQIEGFATTKSLPVYRLPLTREVLVDLRDQVILSKGRFLKNYGHLLSNSPAAVAASGNA